MDKYTKKTVSDDLEKYCILTKKHDFIEVTEWHNGEGFDVCIGRSSGSNVYQFSWGELKAIKKLVKELDKMKD